MKIRCNCGEFTAELTGLPKNTPGRVVCYCSDCQRYAEKIEREDVLDEYGGTQVIPVYPSEFTILSGIEHLKCNRLTRRLNRWTADCCNSPIGNTLPKIPWIGVFHSAISAEDPDNLEGLGPIKSRIYGNDAKGSPPFKISPKIGFGDMAVVVPFIIKGRLTGKAKGNPLFREDGKTPISRPHTL